jgi:hypothetical protein
MMKCVCLCVCMCACVRTYKKTHALNDIMCVADAGEPTVLFKRKITKNLTTPMKLSQQYYLKKNRKQNLTTLMKGSPQHYLKEK